MTDLDPVMVGEPLWVLTKDGHVAEARVRASRDYGLELRFSIDDSLYHSQIFRDRQLLEQAAREKRADFEARGWRGRRGSCRKGERLRRTRRAFPHVRNSSTHL